MNVVDFVLYFNHEHVLEKIAAYGAMKEWLSAETLSELKRKTALQIFNVPIREHSGTVEFFSRFFRYQMEKEGDGFTLLLSSAGVIQHFYEEALNRVTEGIQIYDRNGYFIFSNHASEKLGQYSSKDFEGRHILDLYDLREEFSTVLSVLRTQEPVLNRCDRFQVHQGKTLTTINSGYPIKNRGAIEGAVVFESDLTALERTRKRLMHLETYSDVNQSKNTASSLYTFDDIIHQSESMSELIHFSKKISFTDSSILIIGETGTGKELIAQSIHTFSPRRNKPFIDVNCSAVPSNLFESLFFGTEIGAFTGSISGKGYFEMADGGTLFLDEVNSIPPEMQAKLLRVIQEKRFQRIGGTKQMRCDVRIIVACNEDPEKLIFENRIRKDFYYRVSTFKIELPRLEERREDIPELAKFFLSELKQKYKLENLQFCDETLSILMNSKWPGNIRELMHVIEYAFARVHDDEVAIAPEHLPGYLQSQDGYAFRHEETLHKEPTLKDSVYKDSVYHEEHDLYNGDDFETQVAAFEKKVISHAYRHNAYNVTHTAKALGMSRQNLQYHLKKHLLIE